MHSPSEYKVPIVLCLAFLTVDSFGELIMIQHPPIIGNNKIVQNLTCMSENDGSALVWNENFEDSTGKAFFSANLYPNDSVRNGIIHPKVINAQNGWIWSDAGRNPMGPVMDYRWEDFPLGKVKRNSPRLHGVYSNAMVFSARGSDDIFAWLCVENISRWQIKFADSEDENPVIDSCENVDCNRHPLRDQSHNKSKSRVQWRTFIIEWDPDQKKIQASIDGTEQKKEKSVSELEKITKLQIYTVNDVLFKFHFYSYYLSTTDKASLTTGVFHTRGSEICFELPVSLCSQCQLNVNVIDDNGNNCMTKNITGNGKLTYGGLPTWQTVKFNTPLARGCTNPLKLILSTTFINETNKTGRWAIGTSRFCGDAVLQSTRTFPSLSDASDIACQKLSYAENSIVYSTINITNISSSSLDQCLRGGVGLFCDFKCNGPCNGTSICNPSGCTCAPGFEGDNCNEECPEGFHGYNCQRNGSIVLNDPKGIQEHSMLLHFIWPAILLTFVAGLLFAVYRKRKNIHLKMTSRRVDNVLLSRISEPNESVFRCCADPQKLKSFERYVKKAAENGVLHQQFRWLPRGMERSCDDGKLAENRSKNRYANLIAYDETRVMLLTNSRCPGADYINANYIKGYCKENAYIATQGPVQGTIIDFWRMIWQEEVRIICMLVNIIERDNKMCEQYWPALGAKMEYGDVVVTHREESVFAHYTYRSFLVTKRNKTEYRKVEHLHYTGWPDEGVPMYSHSVAEYLNKLLSIPTGEGPILVHCSSGMGRTGCIILCDICLRCMAVEGTVDVFAEAKNMYRARGNMLDDFPQYVLAHLVPTQCLLFLPTHVLCRDMSREKIEEMKQDLPVHIKRLAKSSWTDRVLHPVEPPKPPIAENVLKNRFPKFMPAGPSLVTLTRYPACETNSDYISAVSVDGVKIRKQYLASQLPMPSTLTDFWRLIVERNVEFVIVLQRPHPADESCCEFVPCGTTEIPLPHVTVKTKISYNSSEYFKTDKLVLTNTLEGETGSRNITVLTCKNWSLNHDAKPPRPEALVDLWRASEKISRVEGPTLVLCHDGVTGCGLYLALSFMLERMTVEQECDVILAVRAVRRSRLEFVYSAWQFEYLYDAALKYAESFGNYANFT